MSLDSGSTVPRKKNISAIAAFQFGHFHYNHKFKFNSTFSSFASSSLSKLQNVEKKAND